MKSGSKTPNPYVAGGSTSWGGAIVGEFEWRASIPFLMATSGVAATPGIFNLPETPGYISATPGDSGKTPTGVLYAATATPGDALGPTDHNKRGDEIGKCISLPISFRIEISISRAFDEIWVFGNVANYLQSIKVVIRDTKLLNISVVIIKEKLDNLSLCRNFLKHS
jgi:hypothetical protein